MLREMADLEHLARLPRYAVHPRASRPAPIAVRDGPTIPRGGLPTTTSSPTRSRTWSVPRRRRTAADAMCCWMWPDRGRSSVSGAPIRAGTLRIYIDGETVPSSRRRSRDSCGGRSPLSWRRSPTSRRAVTTSTSPSPIAAGASSPLTASSRRIRSRGKPTAKLYYQVGYRSYRPEAAPGFGPFSQARSLAPRARSGRVAAVLRDGLPPLAPRSGRTSWRSLHAAVRPDHPSVVDRRRPRGGGRIARAAACDTGNARPKSWPSPR